MLPGTIKLLVIGKAAKPRSFRNFNCPVDYDHSKSACMTATIFKQCFHSSFVPQAPQPVEKWNGIKDATKDGDPSFQRDESCDVNGKICGSEDCLVLNVFTRNIASLNNLKPVMVYIHCGGFTMGSNISELYGPELLLMEDIVVVVLNYRLGLLGYLCLEDASLDIPGNAGLKDQTLGLKWVQRNIKVFGGDPNNVTIFGNSSGAACVHFHVLSQASKGLFNKAIIQSGVALGPHAIGPPNKSIAEVLGKKGATDREILSVLKNMTAEEILAIQEKNPDPLLFEFPQPFGPVVEKPNPSAFITRHPFEIITSGEYNHVPLFIGYTSAEGLILEVLKERKLGLKDNFNYKNAIPWILETSEEQNNKIEKLMSQFYSNQNQQTNEQMIMMDLILSIIVTTIVHHVKTSKCPIYVYRLQIDCQRNFLKQVFSLQEFEGAAHGDELGFLFNAQFIPKIEPNTLEYSMVNTFIRLWTNFAPFGNPIPDKDNELNLSPVKEENNITVLNIDKDLTVLKDIPERERMELWKKILSFGQKTANYL